MSRPATPIIAARPLASSAARVKGPNAAVGSAPLSRGIREATEKMAQVARTAGVADWNWVRADSPVASSAPIAAKRPNMARRPLKISVGRTAAAWAGMWSGGIETGVCCVLAERSTASQDAGMMQEGKA